MRSNGNRKKKMPRAAYRKTVSKLAPLKSRDRKSCNGTIGESARDSMKKKAIRDAQPTIKGPQTEGWLQPRLADSMKPNVTPPRPAVAISAPVQSMVPRAVVLLSGTRQTESPITTAARGTLTKNAQRQEACSINHPPRIGPIADVIAVKPDQV